MLSGFVIGDRGLSAAGDTHPAWMSGHAVYGLCRVVGASAIGKIHLAHNKPRDDAFLVRAAGPWLAVAVSDGLGSRPLSRYGATYVVEALTALLLRQVLPPLKLPADDPSSTARAPVSNTLAPPPEFDELRLSIPASLRDSRRSKGAFSLPSLPWQKPDQSAIDLMQAASVGWWPAPLPSIPTPAPDPRQTRPVSLSQQEEQYRPATRPLPPDVQIDAPLTARPQPYDLPAGQSVTPGTRPGFDTPRSEGMAPSYWSEPFEPQSGQPAGGQRPAHGQRGGAPALPSRPDLPAAGPPPPGKSTSSAPRAQADNEPDALKAMHNAFEKTHVGLREHANSLGLDLADLGCTALALLLNCRTGRVVVGQVGDGAILGLNSQRRVKELLEADDSEDPQATYTINKPNFQNHLVVQGLAPPRSNPFAAYYIMTDGVSGDVLFGDESALDTWALQVYRNLLLSPTAGQASAGLLNWLATYEVKGSFDDRTLIVITNGETANGNSQPAAWQP